MRRTESGFALPLTVFLIALVTLMLTTAFTRVTSDRRIGDASGANITAMSIAKAALHNYLGTRTIRPPDGDSIRINVTGGYADVIAKVLRKPVDTLANWMFVVRAVGHVIDPTQGADPQAVRTVAQFAQWQTGRIARRAAFTAANGLNTRLSGGSVWIGSIPDPSCGPDTLGLRLPSGGTNYPWGFPSGTNNYDPDYFVGGFDQPWNHATTADSTNIDWNGLINGGFTPDATSIQAGDLSNRSQLVTGNATLSDAQGTGLLIVTGDLTTSGGWAQWDGIILVGGRIIFNSTWTYFEGMVVSGLNRQLGTTVAKGDIGGSGKTIYINYHSCSVNEALSKLTGFAPITNGWIDNWATY